MFPPIGWVAAVEILAGIIPGILDNAENLVKQQVANGINGAMSMLPTNQAQIEGPLPGTPVPNWSFVINDFVVSEQAIESYISAMPKPEQPYLMGSTSMPFFDLHPVTFSLTIPPGLFNPQDPTVFVRWVVTRTDTNEILTTKDLPISGVGVLGPMAVFTVVVDPTPAPLMVVDSYDVQCTVYRALGGGPSDVTIADAFG